jgi:translation initiation factor 2B subunit (eIF-2B alpha/beta/delta family)
LAAIARVLAEASAEVTLVADAACGIFIREASAVVVGADSVRADGGVVNKVGTYPLALAAHVAQVPVYVLCETLKIAPPSLPLTFEEMDPTELLPEPSPHLTARNPYFDYTPPELVSALISEEGPLDRPAIQARAERAGEALAGLLEG